MYKVTVCPAITNLNNVERWGLASNILNHFITPCLGIEGSNFYYNLSCTFNFKLSKDFDILLKDTSRELLSACSENLPRVTTYNEFDALMDIIDENAAYLWTGAGDSDIRKEFFQVAVALGTELANDNTTTLAIGDVIKDFIRDSSISDIPTQDVKWSILNSYSEKMKAMLAERSVELVLLGL